MSKSARPDASRRRFLTAAAGTVGSSLLASCARPAPVCPPSQARADRAAPRGIRYRKDAPAVFVCAHCDDAAIEAWHLLSTLRPVKLVNAFMAVPPDGTMATDDKMGTYDAAAYMRARQAEERAVLGRIGIEPLFLSGLDMPYRNGKLPNLGTLATELARLVPEASALICPLGLGIRLRVGTQHYSHVDHKFARDIADSFADVPKVYFGEVYALSEKASNYDELYAHLQEYKHWRVEKITLDAAALKAKTEAFYGYKTQQEGLLSGVPDILEPSVLGTEIYCYPSG